jgi:hypothetical protein
VCLNISTVINIKILTNSNQQTRSYKFTSQVYGTPLNDKKPFSLSVGHTQVLTMSVHLSVYMSIIWFSLNNWSYPKANNLKFMPKVRDHKRKARIRIRLYNTFWSGVMPFMTLASSSSLFFFFFFFFFGGEGGWGDVYNYYIQHICL